MPVGHFFCIKYNSGHDGTRTVSVSTEVRVPSQDGGHDPACIELETLRCRSEPIKYIQY